MIIKDHENQTEYIVEPQNPSHQMRDRMKDYDAQLKTQILIDNRHVGKNGSMNIHHQPMLTRYHPQANYYGHGAAHYPDTPYVPPG